MTQVPSVEEKVDVSGSTLRESALKLMFNVDKDDVDKDDGSFEGSVFRFREVYLARLP